MHRRQCMPGRFVNRPYERYRTAVYFVGNGLRAVPFIDLRCIWNGTQAVPYEC